MFVLKGGQGGVFPLPMSSGYFNCIAFIYLLFFLPPSPPTHSSSVMKEVEEKETKVRRIQSCLPIRLALAGPPVVSFISLDLKVEGKEKPPFKVTFHES